MGFSLKKMFTVPGSSAASSAANSQAQLTDWQYNNLKNFANNTTGLQSQWLSGLSGLLNQSGNTGSKVNLQTYTPQNYTMPDTPTNSFSGINGNVGNAYSGVSTPTFNYENLPDAYKPSAETLSYYKPTTSAQDAGTQTKNNYAMNANQALSDRSNSINTALLQRGLGGRQGGMSTAETSALSGLATQAQKLNAEGALAALNAQNNQETHNASLVGQGSDLERNAANDAISRANTNQNNQNNWLNQNYNNQMNLANANQGVNQQNYSNLMNLANANQSFSQQDYQNKINNISQLRDWMTGDVNQANNTSLQQASFNNNVDQTKYNNMIQALSMLGDTVSPTALNGNISNLASQYGSIASNANQQANSNLNNLMSLASLAGLL